jgi:GntR family transcriptional regulator
MGGGSVTAAVVSGPGRAELDRESALPLWAQLHDDLCRRLDEGEFTGSFPGEMALAEQYGVSRNTVREAVRRLRTEGVVVAGRGRRPRLATSVEIEQPLGALYSLFASVQAAGLEQRSVVRSLSVEHDGQAAEILGLEAAAPLVYLERLRFAGDRPLALDRVWLPATEAEGLLGVDFSHTSLYEQLAERTGIRLVGGREHIRAVVPTDDERAVLGIDDGIAAFSIERLGMTRDGPVEFRRSLVRGDRFSVTAVFSAQGGYQLGLDASGSHAGPDGWEPFDPVARDDGPTGTVT